MYQFLSRELILYLQINIQLVFILNHGCQTMIMETNIFDCIYHLVKKVDCYVFYFYPQASSYSSLIDIKEDQ